jgi:hypothetical protein
MLDESYGLQGWDKQSGHQTHQGLAEIGLEDLANKLAEAGKLIGISVRSWTESAQWKERNSNNSLDTHNKLSI